MRYAHFAHNVTYTLDALFAIKVGAGRKTLNFATANDKYVVAFFGNSPGLVVLVERKNRNTGHFRRLFYLFGALGFDDTSDFAEQGLNAVSGLCRNCQ